MRDTSDGRGPKTIRMRKARRFRGAVSGVLLVLAACVLVVCSYQTASGRWHATPVLSGSMRPGLQPGDVVVTQRVPISDLHVRDVIVFHPPNQPQQLTVHRIVRLKVRKGTAVITTRGDANTIDDPAVTSLRGASAYRVVRVVPLVGYPAVWLSGGHHGLFVIGLGILLLIGAAVVLLRPEAPRKELRPTGVDLDSDDDREGAGRIDVPSTPTDAGPSSSPELFVLAGHARGGDDTRSKGKEQNAHELAP